MTHDVRMRGFRDRTEVANALRLLDERTTVLPSESVSVQQTVGRILAADVMATVDVPSFLRSAMDGYALRADETFGASQYNAHELNVVGEVFPGEAFPGTVGPGEAVRIMTGAPLPEGADAVLQAEAAEAVPGSRPRVRVTEAVPPGRNVGRVGEDVAEGSVVLRAGRRLRPQDAGVLASIGASPVSVVRRPCVAILITGNELLPAGSRPEGFRIVDSNSVMLAGLVVRDGGLLRVAPLVPDEYDAVRKALVGFLDFGAEVVLISGGSSVGQEDHAPRVVRELGEMLFHGVALRPASPAGVGIVRGAFVFLLPGNPVSCLCAYDLFAGRVIRRLGARSTEMPYPTASLPLARKIASVVGRVDYVRVAIRDGRVEPLATSGASVLSSTTRADGFVLVRHDSEGHAEGETVVVHLYDLPS